MKTRYLVASLLLTTLVATSAFALVRTSSTRGEEPTPGLIAQNAPLVQSALGLSRPL
jgi:hypothetical protein